MRLAPFILFASFNLSPISAQETYYWDEDYRLDYNYDPESSRGPENWGDINVSDSFLRQYEDHEEHDIEYDGNECDKGYRPSPINLVKTTSCEDRHEILLRKIKRNDCTKYDVTFEIIPTGLRAYFPKDDDDCNRPTVDLSWGFPHKFYIKWMDIRIPAEHSIEGKLYDAEIQMFHLGTEEDDDKAAIVSVLMEANSREDNAELQWLIDGWQEIKNDMDEYCDWRRRTSDAKWTGKQKNITGPNRRRRKKDRRRAGARQKTLSEEEENILYFGIPNPSRDEHGNVFQTEEDIRALLETYYNRTNLPEDERQRRVEGCTADRLGLGCEPLGPRKRMFPYNLWPNIWYYRYRGSITYPPCTDNVQWRIIEEPMLITRRQLKQMARLSKSYRDYDCESDTAVSPKGSNARPLQERSEVLFSDDVPVQSIKHCTYDDFSYRLFLPEQQ